MSEGWLERSGRHRPVITLSHTATTATTATQHTATQLGGRDGTVARVGGDASLSNLRGCHYVVLHEPLFSSSQLSFGPVVWTPDSSSVQGLIPVFCPAPGYLVHAPPVRVRVHPPGEARRPRRQAPGHPQDEFARTASRRVLAFWISTTTTRETTSKRFRRAQFEGLLYSVTSLPGDCSPSRT